MEISVPVNIPSVSSGNEEVYLSECIKSGWVSSEGPFVSRFETALSVRLGRKHAISLSSGSAALEVAYTAISLKPGDEVIIPTFAIIAVVSGIVRRGAIPVPVDCDRKTFNVTRDTVVSAITPMTRCITLVHTYHFPCDISDILEGVKLKEKEFGIKIWVVEDAAEMIGQSYKGLPCGSFGDISCLSFYPNKLVTTGEGGMVLTDEDALAARCSGARNLFFNSKRRFVHEELGFNFRMSNLQAAVGLAQVERLNQHIVRKREIGRLYSQLLEGLGEGKGGRGWLRLPEDTWNGEERKQHVQVVESNLYWVYGIVVLTPVVSDVSSLTDALRDKWRIGTRPFFWCMHEQPALKDLNGSLPNSEFAARRGFYLPSGLGTSDDQVKYVAEKLILEITGMVAGAE